MATPDSPANPSADRDDTPIRGRGGNSPKSIDLPFWVDAFLHLDPPRQPGGKVRDAARWRIYPVVRALLADRMNVRGDEAVQLNREKLAKWAGFGHARNCGWLFEYLERIGFLEVQHHPSSSGQGSDTFDVFTEPPENYVGPMTYAELDMAITAGARYPLLTGNDRIPWAKPNSAHEEVGSNPNSAHTEVGSENPRAKPNSAHEEVGSNPNSAHTEVGSENPRAKPNSAHAEPSRARYSSYAPSGRSGGEERPEGSSTTKPAADAAAGTSHGEEIDDWARQLALALPWSQRMSRTPSRDELGQLADRFRQVAAEHGLAQAEVQQRALQALAKANPAGPKSNPVRFVQGAFDDRWLTAAPVTESLSLPQESQGNTGGDEPQDAAGESEQLPVDRFTGEVLPRWCGECNEGMSVARTVKKMRIGVQGSQCSACHPDYTAADTAHGEAA